MIEKLKGALANSYARAVVVVTMLGPGLALADGGGGSADAFTDAVTALTTKIASYGAALVGVAAVGIGFMVAVKYVKKLRGAA